ncbi:MAG: tyrosine-type recombinase/integrase [Candidatus Marinimicrobia bacterium]|jgi:site-specific recombinase XerD|nr:tyrosine-type recombinase/integrase [Candidatus Neomarinimicrobiota bacterium]
MGTISSKITKKGILHYYGNLTVNGKRINRFLGLSRPTAIMALKQLEFDMRFGDLVPKPEVVSYRDAIRKFQIHVELTGITYEQVKYIGVRIKRFQAYCKQQGVEELDQITADHSQGYLARRKMEKVTKTYNYGKEGKWKHPATSTINREIGFQKRFFRFCSDNGWIKRNPWALISRVKNDNNREPRYSFTEEELKRILERSGKFYDFYFFLLHTGLRPTDTFVLSSESFEGNMMTVRQRKTGEWLQNIPVSEEVLSTIDHRIAAGGFLFPELQSDRQRRYARRLVQGLFEPEFVRKNNINLHTFRHTYARRMLNKGMPKEVLQTFLGHRSVRTTEIYANWVNSVELSKWVT